MIKTCYLKSQSHKLKTNMLFIYYVSMYYVSNDQRKDLGKNRFPSYIKKKILCTGYNLTTKQESRHADRNVVTSVIGVISGEGRAKGEPMKRWLVPIFIDQLYPSKIDVMKRFEKSPEDHFCLFYPPTLVISNILPSTLTCKIKVHRRIANYFEEMWSSLLLKFFFDIVII